MTAPAKTISTQSLQPEGRTFPPPADAIKRAHINAESYKQMYERSVNDSDAFWLEQCATLEWFKQPTVARKYTWDTARRNIQHTWFEDGVLNVSVNCLDRHLRTATRNKTAIIWQGEGGTNPNRFTPLTFWNNGFGGPPPPVVPEPSTLALGAIGSLVLLLCWRKSARRHQRP